MKGKKGQITVFIILGIVLLLSLGLFIFFKSNFSNIPVDALSDELKPVKIYVEECMKDAATDAVNLMAQQGGYIEVPPYISNSPSRYVNPDGLGIVKVPYWFYKGNRYSPSISSVQRDISKYVEENVRECISDFEAFPQFNIIELKDLKVETILNRNDVSLEMDYPIRIEYRANSTSTLIEKFSTKLDVRLRKMIETANKILDSELKTFFLENFTIDLMASNSNIPFTDMKFTCSQLRWNINDIKQEVEDMLYYNLPRIRVKNTDYVSFIEDEKEYNKLLDYHLEDIAKGNYPKNPPSDAYEYLHMFWDIGLKDKELISAGFSFMPQVGMDLIGRPNDNGVLKSKFAEGNKEFIRMLCVNVYHFLYDANYPVVVTLRDDLSFGGTGYVFRFAMPVTIHNNAPFKENYAYDMFTTTYFDRGFCEERGNDLVSIKAIGKEEGYDNLELKDANISLQCFKYYCDLGKTMAVEGRYQLRTTLPKGCDNPFIIAEKEGYLKSKKQYTGEDTMELKLTKLKELDYEVVYHRYNSVGDKIEDMEFLEDDMQASIQLITGDFDQYKPYPAQEGEGSKIQLIEGDAEYDIDIVFTQNDEFIGGYKGKWKANGLDVANAEKIVFHVIKYVPVPFSQEEQLKMMGYLLQGDYRVELEPELI